MFEAKESPFKLKGLSAGINVGLSQLSAAGEVYDMKEVARFPGIYTKLTARKRPNHPASSARNNVASPRAHCDCGWGRAIVERIQVAITSMIS